MLPSAVGTVADFSLDGDAADGRRVGSRRAIRRPGQGPAAAAATVAATVPPTVPLGSPPAASAGRIALVLRRCDRSGGKFSAPFGRTAGWAPARRSRQASIAACV